MPDHRSFRERQATLGAPLVASLTAMGFVLATLIAITVLFVRRADDTLAQLTAQASLAATLPQLRAIETNLLNAETGQRGYLLTRRLDYLVPYEDAVARLPALQESLKTRSIEDAEVRAKIVRIIELSRLKLAELAETIRLQRSGDHAAAMAIVLGDSGKAYMEEARVLIDAATAQLAGERDLLGTAIAADAASSKRLLVLVVALLILTAAFVVVQLLRSLGVQRALVKRLDDEAMHDPLTHLPNRRFFDLWMGKCVAMADRGERDLSLIALDLDRFKLVNDDDGHEAGDALLVDIATAFKEALRGSDFLCRTGGDEFAVVTSDGANHEAVERLAARLIASVERAAGTSSSARAGVTASAGIAIYPTDGATAEELMRAADLALYSAKTHGKGRARFHNPAHAA